MQARFKSVWQIVLAACTTALVLLLAEVFVERQRLQTLQVESENQVREQLLVLQARVESQLNGNIQLAREVAGAKTEASSGPSDSALRWPCCSAWCP